MRILTGYMPATAGKAIVAGYDVFEQPVEAKRRTGYLPETPPLYPDMTVQDYLTFVSKIKGVQPGERKQRIKYVMERVRVADMANRLCARLSKGYKQRVGLAQALIHNPDVLILDEPTAGLDPKQIIETRQLIKELAGDHTIILSTHILPEVEQICERVVIIAKGKLVATDTVSTLTTNLRGAETIQIQVIGGDEASVRERLDRISGIQNVSAAPDGRFTIEAEKEKRVRPEIAKAIIASGWDLNELHGVSMSLEDIFLELTSG